VPSTTKERARRAQVRPRHLRVVGREDRRVRSTGRPGGARVRAMPRPAPRRDHAVTVLLLSTAALTLLGLVMVLSASSVSAYARYGSSFLFFQRQVAYAAAGSLGLWLASRMNHRAWERLCVPMLALTVALLALVLHPSAGTVAGGSARWLVVGPVTIQPSEIAKLAVIAFGATLLARRWHRLHDLRALLVPLGPVVGLVAGLILLQPDMGTALIVVAGVFALLFAAGSRIVHLVTGAAGLGAVGFGLMYIEGYRWARFTSFLDPWADPQGSGYQTIQSIIALVGGGPFGVGLGASRQKWMYVPNAHTDFIYAILGEELGLIGAIGVLALFGLLVWAGIRIAMRAPDAFGRLLAAGITGWLGVQALVNLGAVTGLLPITGVPLPLVSFGGSSLVVTLVAIGILVSIGRRGSRART
jgi:cell division protein FtsW